MSLSSGVARTASFLSGKLPGTPTTISSFDALAAFTSELGRTGPELRVSRRCDDPGLVGWLDAFLE